MTSYRSIQAAEVKGVTIEPYHAPNLHAWTVPRSRLGKGERGRTEKWVVKWAKWAHVFHLLSQCPVNVAGWCS